MTSAPFSGQTTHQSRPVFMAQIETNQYSTRWGSHAQQKCTFLPDLNWPGLHLLPIHLHEHSNQVCQKNGNACIKGTLLRKLNIDLHRETDCSVTCRHRSHYFVILDFALLPHYRDLLALSVAGSHQPNYFIHTAKLSRRNLGCACWQHREFRHNTCSALRAIVSGFTQNPRCRIEAAYPFK